MANPEHVELLDRGVEVWNSWRRANLDVRPDLSAVQFGGTEHSPSGHVRAQLRDVAFRGTFITAKLPHVDLSGADLNGACFVGAVLHGASLRDAQMIATDFTGADLSLSDVTGAWFLDTLLHGASLHDLRGLDSARFLGQCHLDEDTVRRSWPIDESSLRAFGVSAPHASFLQKAVLASAQLSCLLSHSNKDAEFANALHQQLTDRQVRCWLASKDLPIGASIRDALHDAVAAHQRVIVVLSEHSIRSQWVEDEVERALERERAEKVIVLFPVRIDDAVYQANKGWARYLRNTRNIGDFRDWRDHSSFEAMFRRLVSDLANSIRE